MLVVLLLLLALSNAVKINGDESHGQCNYNKQTLQPRPHSVSISEFGAVGDGKTLNTIAFQNAIFYLKSFADKGGAQLYVPPGRWLTGSFSLTSHLTLFLEKGAIILGSQDPSHWEVVDPLPSYGRGIEIPGSRYRSLINGYNVKDVVITGDNGTIDGQGSVWWDWFNSHSLKYSRPHLVEFVDSQSVVVSNLSFVNAPAYGIHPVYCSNVHVHNISVSIPLDSPHTNGIVPDSSDGVCIEDCAITSGYDAISLKSGWDEYGIAYGRPTKNVHIRRVDLQSSSGSSLAFGSEMSGGISNVLVEQVHLYNSHSGVEFRTTKGRGGYIKQITISDVVIKNVFVAFSASGQCGSHPDDKYDPTAIPVLDHISLQNVVGKKISVAGIFNGIQESPFTSICLYNISLSINSGAPTTWECSNVSGSSDLVSPEPCSELHSTKPNSPSGCFSLSTLYGKASAF
ncbi:probable polygalacturonase isoform X2 [Cannabis sativa]|uniref:probable polygalacturonase isoform X2 n=1 Tax=Cannabis sativa TaxID=3483 RepID=UPI0029C9F619|nr:probable polygalacturonase isoform X2 [Cannabis sativa]XP_060960487.1 probable polygalacturonase isoform X2 [Cannabis sativa]